MIQLILGNSYSQLIGLTSHQHKELQKELSYVVGGSSAYFSGFGVRRKSLLDKKGFFPSGLLSRIQNWIDTGKGGLDIKVIDNRLKIPKPWPTAPKDAYEWQRAALVMADRYERGIISAPTGTGKSRVMGMIAKSFNLKTLVVVPSLEIKKQLQETAFKGMPHVIVENIASTALNRLTDFDVLILDEAHHAASKTYYKLNKTAWKGIYYRFCFTATPFRNDTEETLLFESIAGRVIYKLDYKTAIKEKYIVPVEAYYIDLLKQETDAFTYQQVYSELVVNNFTRNLLISSTLLKLDGNNKKTLCLVKEVAHGKALAELTGLPFVHGQDEDSRRYIQMFNDGEINTLIGTTGVIGEGVDTKPCEYVIIATPGKAKSQFMQQVGRAVRNYPDKESAKIILFRDSSHKYLLKHYNAQKAILKEEYGCIPIKLDVD